MAAHLDLVHLRRHALPTHFMVAATEAAVPAPTALLDRAARSSLLATWRLDAGGRLVCAWIVGTDDLPLMPA